MKCNIPQRVLREIISFAKENNVERVILFGSRAKGCHTERSDIDIAATGGDFDQFYWALKERAHTLLMFDIVNMSENISSELRNEIEKYGVVLYEKAR